jgi:hypothetical protein
MSDREGPLSVNVPVVLANSATNHLGGWWAFSIFTIIEEHKASGAAATNALGLPETVSTLVLDMANAALLHRGWNDGAGGPLRALRQQVGDRTPTPTALSAAAVNFRTGTTAGGGQGMDKGKRKGKADVSLPNKNVDDLRVCIRYKTLLGTKISEMAFVCDVTIIPPSEQIRPDSGGKGMRAPPRATGPSTLPYSPTPPREDPLQTATIEFRDSSQDRLATRQWYPMIVPGGVYILRHVLLNTIIIGSHKRITTGTISDLSTIESVPLPEHQHPPSHSHQNQQQQNQQQQRPAKDPSTATQTLDDARDHFSARMSSFDMEVASKCVQVEQALLRPVREVLVQDTAKSRQAESFSIKGTVKSKDIVVETVGDKADFGATLKICLAESDGPDEVAVYMRMNDFVEPIGLVPGAVVHFWRLQAAVSAASNNLYFKTTRTSCLTIVEHVAIAAVEGGGDSRLRGGRSDASMRGRFAPDPVTLSSLRRGNNSVNLGVQRTMVRVESVQKLKVWFACKQCGVMPLREAKCSNHPDADPTFTAACTLNIEDGTADARAYINAESTSVVFQVLKLSPTELSRLKSTCRQFGELEVKSWEDEDTPRESDPALGDLTRYIKRPRIFRQVFLMFKQTKRVPDGTTETKITLQKQKYTTFKPHPLSLTTFGVQEINYTEKAAFLLRQLAAL